MERRGGSGLEKVWGKRGSRGKEVDIFGGGSGYLARGFQAVVDLVDSRAPAAILVEGKQVQRHTRAVEGLRRCGGGVSGQVVSIL